MNVHGTGRIFAVAALLLTVVAGGCANKDKEQLATLQAQYNELSNRNNDLKGELAEARAREAELISQLDSKDLQMSNKDRELVSLQAKLADKGSQPTAATGSQDGWDIGKFADRISVGSDILFEAGKATLSSQGKTQLDKVAQTIKTTYAGMPVRVYGHTDSDPINKTKKLWDDNLDLSANRAMAVTRYLQGKGIDAKNIETVAMGEAIPVVKNDSKPNKAKNRRVEIVVIKQ